MRPNPVRGLIGAVLSLLLLTSCGVGDVLRPVLPDWGGPSGDETRTPPPELHPGLRDCAPVGSDDTLGLSDADLGDASWSTPDRFFDVTASYIEDNPVEDLQWGWVAGSKDLPAMTLDVISISHYTGVSWHAYTKDCQAVPLEAVKEKLAQYRTHIGATPLSDPELITVDGQAAITQDLRLKEYDYEGYWIFSTDELLHVYCQWENSSAEETIRRGCKELVSSVRIP